MVLESRNPRLTYWQVGFFWSLSPWLADGLLLAALYGRLGALSSEESTSSLSPLDTALITVSLQENADRKFVTYKPRGVPPTLPRPKSGTLWIQLHSGLRKTRNSHLIHPSIMTMQAVENAISNKTKINSPASTLKGPLWLLFWN